MPQMDGEDIVLKGNVYSIVLHDVQRSSSLV